MTKPNRGEVASQSTSKPPAAASSVRRSAGRPRTPRGIVPPKGKLTVTMTEPTMPLNNDGDEVLLMDGGGVVRSRVAYAGEQARAGAWVEFAD